MAERPATICPVARAAPIVGDRWTSLILHELLLGSHRFEELQAYTGAAPNMVTSRLKRLEGDGMIERRRYQDRPARHEYFLTAKGLAYGQVLIALRAWGEQWCKTAGEAAAGVNIHRPCEGLAGTGPDCATCGAALRTDEIFLSLGPEFQSERRARWDKFKARNGSR